MEARAKLFGHSIHQILVPIPLGLFIMATVCDVIVAAGGTRSLAIVSFWDLFAGVIGGLAAAVFGLVDLTAIPRQSRAFKIGVVHGVGNVIVVGLFALCVFLRWDTQTHVATVAALTLEILAFVMAGVTGWLGGELVNRLGVGVDDHANVNAPSSLAGATVR